MTARRLPLPDRRPNLTAMLRWRQHDLAVTIGFDAAGLPREVFAHGARVGSDVQALLDDACTALSVAMQQGASAWAMGRSMGSAPVLHGPAGAEEPASLFGAVMWLLRREVALSVCLAGRGACACRDADRPPCAPVLRALADAAGDAVAAVGFLREGGGHG